MNSSDYYDLMRIPAQVRRDAEAILFELEGFEDGASATTARLAAELLGRGDDRDSYLLDLDRALGLLAENHGLLLDKSHHDGMIEGLPHNLDFFVWHRA